MSEIVVLSVPLKKGWDVDIVKPLKNMISSTSDKKDEYTDAISTLSTMRHIALKLGEKSESSLEHMAKYYDQLSNLTQKIPTQELQIPFKWQDAFSKGSVFGGRITLTVSSISYEMVATLFNYGAMCTQVAAAQNLESEEGLKKANKHLQTAAGIFNQLKDRVVAAIEQEPTPDLEPETLTLLSAICLAQAQELVVQKALKDKMKESIIAKLSKHADDLFSDVLKNMQKESVRSLWDKDWVAVVSGKQALYNGLAQYHQSRVCNAEKAIGEEISRLQYALELFTAAEKRAGYTIGCSKDWYKRSNNYLTEAKKDNDFIYHERIPEVGKLAPVGKAAVVKATEVPDRFFAQESDLFEKLTPVHIQQALSAFNARKQELVQKEVNKLKESSNLLNELLSSMNLPAALEDTTGGGCPPSLKEKSASVMEAGGVAQLEKLMQELPELLQRNTDLLNESERMLREEKDSDDKLRAQYKDKWNRTPSDKLTSTFTTNASKYRSIINTAQDADSIVKDKFNAHLHGMRALASGEGAMIAFLPQGAGGQGGSASTQLKQLMEQVETLRAERAVIDSELRNANVDMKSVFLSAAAGGGVNEPVLSVQHLDRAYSGVQGQVNQSVTSQEQLIAQIQDLYQAFIQERGGKGGDRETALKSLAQAYDAYMELKSNLEEGTKFYNDLTQLLVTFQNKVTDFTFARKTEKEELLKDMTTSMANLSMAAPPQAPSHHAETTDPSRPPRKNEPPARPPPPTVQPGGPIMADSAAGASSAPPPQQQAPNPYGGAPGPLPYPIQPNNMPMPYNPYTPMPVGYNPYAGYPQQPNIPAYPQQAYYAPPPQGYPPQPGYYGYPPQGQQGYPPQPPQGGYPPQRPPQ